MPLSPTALTIQIGLESTPGGPFSVRDDPDSYAILVNDKPVVWVNKMSGGWLSCDPSLPENVRQDINKVLGFAPSSGRGFRHIEWRNQHLPPPADVRIELG